MSIAKSYIRNYDSDQFSSQKSREWQVLLERIYSLIAMTVCITTIDRSAAGCADDLAGFGVATVHEAQGRKGLLDAGLRPVYRPVAIAGTAVTCEVAPGDNWMIHVAVEQCRPGDVLVVTPTSPCHDGFFGDLLATSLQARGRARSRHRCRRSRHRDAHRDAIPGLVGRGSAPRARSRRRLQTSTRRSSARGRL